LLTATLKRESDLELEKLMPSPHRIALAVRDLRVELVSGEPIVEDVTLSVAAGEILGVVGESGSGKTTTVLALLGYAREGARIAAGRIEVAGERIDGRDERGTRAVRGLLVSYIPQEPGNCLNPALRIADAIRDVLDAHVRGGKEGVTVDSALAAAQLPATREFGRRYPHQLSGGQQQRVTIAMAVACEPPVLLLDEPTTGLDVVTQARILEEIDRLRRTRSVAMVYVSHNLAVVGQVADRIAVMYAGRIVEEGPAMSLFITPRHPYTRGLVASIPDHRRPHRLHGMPGVAVGVGERPQGCAFAPRCTQKVDRCEAELPRLEEIAFAHRVRCFEWPRTPSLALRDALHRKPKAAGPSPLLIVEGLRAIHGHRHGDILAADDVAFTIGVAECVALVGESGSGKTTIARCLAGLHRPAAGRIVFAGIELSDKAGDRPRDLRRRIQLVFQNPYDSLNPRHRVADAIARPARLLRDLSATEAKIEVVALLEQVRLPSRIAERFPRELSGGERQRVAVARALAARPDLLICDEITSALDVSVQASMLELLDGLREDLGLALLLITHDLGVVAAVADRMLVLESGIVREEGPVTDVIAKPRDQYTRTLIEAAPRLPNADLVATRGV